MCDGKAPKMCVISLSGGWNGSGWEESAPHWRWQRSNTRKQCKCLRVRYSVLDIMVTWRVYVPFNLTRTDNHSFPSMKRRDAKGAVRIMLVIKLDFSIDFTAAASPAGKFDGRKAWRAGGLHPAPRFYWDTLPGQRKHVSFIIWM